MRESSDLLHVVVRGARPGGRCPDCNRASRAVHSRYERRPADLPSLGCKVRIDLSVRRFYCRNPGCARLTFAERLPELVAPHARRTLRLIEAQSRLGVALGGEAAAKVLPRLAMPASPDTVLRLVRTRPLPRLEPPRVVGVDDWAMRKGHIYGTIVVDLERNHVVDLLSDRTSETLAGWLRQRPSIQVIARDRSTEYARGATSGAPGAVQVCDRWHLLANVRQAVERWLHTAHGRLRGLPGLTIAGPVPPRRARAFPRSAPERLASAESRAQWQARYDEVRRRHLAGEALLAIARAMGLARGTVRKYAYAATFPARLPHGPGPSILDPYLPYLGQRLAEGCENGLALWRELRSQGFPGGAKQVHRWLAERRTVPSKFGPQHRRKPDNPRPFLADNEMSSLPAPRQLAWLLVQPTAALAPADAVPRRAGRRSQGRGTAGPTVYRAGARLRHRRSAGRPYPV